MLPIPPFASLEADDLPVERLNATIRGINAGALLAESFSFDVPAQAHIHAFGDLDRLIESYIRHTGLPSRELALQHWGNGQSGAVAMGTARRIFVNFSPAWWDGFGAARTSKVLAHEYFHLIQAQAHDDHARITPDWINEGTAEYFGFTAVNQAGIHPWPAARPNIIRDVQAAPVRDFPLRHWEEAGHVQGMYDLACLAVEYLTKGDLSTLQAFYAAIGTGAGFDAAFSTAFGVSVDEFHESFEAYRVNGFRLVPTP